jgi:hypothetical protein
MPACLTLRLPFRLLTVLCAYVILRSNRSKWVKGRAHAGASGSWPDSPAAAAVTTTRIAWRFRARFDIHLLRGKKRCLDELLLLHQADGTEPTGRDRPLPGDVASLTFAPRIKGAAPGGVINAHGVKVDTATGEVEVVSPAPAPPRLSNLVVEARCQVDDPAAPGGVRNLVATMRIHVHTSVTRAWCTPTALSIHKGADGQRLSVLAQYDDTVGDINELR